MNASKSLRWFTLAALLLCQGCAVMVYHNKDGASFAAWGVLSNEHMSKLAVDRQFKTGRQGIGVAQVDSTVDNAAVEAITEGVVQGLIKSVAPIPK